MPTRTPPSQPLRVVIVGGGVAALEALLALRRLAEERVAIELLTAEPQFWYRPLAVAEPFGAGDVHGLDLSAIADELGAGLTLGSLESIDVDRRVVRTTNGTEVDYEVLLVTTGARPVEAIAGALTFRGPADTETFRTLLRELESGGGRVAFALPGRATWPLPLYELALQTAARAGETVDVVLVTHEEEPLRLFGSAVSEAVGSLLEERRVEVVTGAYPLAFADGVLMLSPSGSVRADRVVALPALEGPALRGLPCDRHGFIPTDPSGRVRGVPHVYAAGDVTAFPIKQGGLAAQQADAAAEAIAAAAGADVEPQPFRPVLRGLILTGDRPVFARAALTSTGDTSAGSTEALWWPPGKIVGRYLTPFLAERADAILTPPVGRGLRVEVALDPVPSRA